MTLVRVDGDNTYDFEVISDHEFKHYTYFLDQNAKIPSSSMLGKYCRIATYRIEFSLKKLREVFSGSDDDNFCYDLMEDDLWDPKLVSHDIEENTGYDPAKYSKLYEAKAKAYAKIEKETGLRLY